MPIGSRGNSFSRGRGRQRSSTDDQPDVADRIADEGGGDIGGGDDRAADRRPEAARDVEAEAVERDRRVEILARHLLADRCLPGGPS